MDANAVMTELPVPRPSRKKGRRDKPFKELKMSFIPITKVPPKARKPEPKQTPAPLVISDWQPQPGTSKEAAKRIRRKNKRKALKIERKNTAIKEQIEAAAAAAESKDDPQVAASKKRKADEEAYSDHKKRVRLGQAEQEIDSRKKLEAKSPRCKGKAAQELAAFLPIKKGKNILDHLPMETLKEVFSHLDPYQRTCVALSCHYFAGIIMQDMADLEHQEAEENRRKQQEEEEKKNKKKQEPDQEMDSEEKKSRSKDKKKEKKANKGEQRAGCPDIKKKYHHDLERRVTVGEQLKAIMKPDERRYCFICRKWELIKEGKVISYKNCPKKIHMADAPPTPQSSRCVNRAGAQTRPASLLPTKVDKVKPVPDEIIWREEDWSYVRIGAIRSRMGYIDELHICPACTDCLNTIHLPPPPETPVVRLGEHIGGTLENGRVPDGHERNKRDDRRRKPGGNVASVTDEDGNGDGAGDVSGAMDVSA